MQYIENCSTSVPHELTLEHKKLAVSGLRLVPQSPYSLELNLCDRFLFTRLQQTLKLEQFDYVSDVVKAAQQCPSASILITIPTAHLFLGS